MGKFTQYQQHPDTDPKEATRRFTWYRLEGEPWVEVVLADSSNSGYINALLRRNRSRSASRQRRVTKATIERQRNEDRKLFARYVVKAWGNVVDTDGDAVEFSAQNCEEFLFAIPYWAFDELRDFAADPESFLEDDEDDDFGGDEAGKD